MFLSQFNGNLSLSDRPSEDCFRHKQGSEHKSDASQGDPWPLLVGTWDVGVYGDPST